MQAIFPGTPPYEPLDGKPVNSFKHSKLENGLTVVTLDYPTPVSSVGLYVKGGASSETDSSLSSARATALMGFHNNALQTGFHTITDLEIVSSEFKFSSTRDFNTYETQFARDGKSTADAIKSLSCVAQPQLREWQLRFVKQTLNTQYAAASNKDKIMDAVHAAAFNGKGKGNPVVATPPAIANLTAPELVNFYKKTFNAKNSVLVGTGIAHESLVDAAKEHFSFLSSEGDSAAASAYTGGSQHVLTGGPTTSFAFAFEGAAQEDQQAVAELSVLKALLGGFDYFGYGQLPGEKAASTLGSASLAHGTTLDAFSLSYEGTGLFGVAGSTPASAAKETVATVLTSLVQAKKATDEEVARAKLMVKRELFNKLNSRFDTHELIVKSIQAGVTEPAIEAAHAALHKVTTASVRAAAAKVLASKPSVAAIGAVSAVPSLDELTAAVK